MWVPVCGISLTLINLRVSLGWAARGSVSGSSGPRISTNARSFETTNQSYAMRSLAVNVTQTMEVDEDVPRYAPEKALDFRRTSKGSDLSV